jgi:hypothetical protein
VFFKKFRLPTIMSKKYEYQKEEYSFFKRKKIKIKIIKKNFY